MRSTTPLASSPMECPSFGGEDLAEARWLVERALAEDLPQGDLTTDVLFPQSSGTRQQLEAAFRARSSGVLCGVPVVQELFRSQAPGLRLDPERPDGARLAAGEAFLHVTGDAGSVLRLERIALNFLQRLSGIATLTARFAEALRGTPAVLLDTRKTTPGWRHLEKYAVRSGGGANHRMSLSEAVLVKDNHIALLRSSARGSFREWVAELRRAAPGKLVEVEVDTREQLLEALQAEPDSILLDNFDLEGLRWAVGRRNAGGTRPLLEASGGVSLERAREVALTGVDRISVGALTHSAPALDIGLDLIKVF